MVSRYRVGFAGWAGKFFRAVALAATTGLLLASSPNAGEANSKYAAIVVDPASGKVLYESSADARRYPASLTKMMTLYVLFEDLERGRFKLNSRLKVSASAAAQPPSKIGLRAGDTITVEDAIRALVTKSANDVAAAVGENVGGSVPAFADRMTRTAKALGMSRTVFKNPHGLPNDGQYTTARDMMKLGVALQVRFPQYYGYFKTRSFSYKGRTHGNHNRLLGRVEGVDGIKTGYIRASGFNLVSSVKRDGRRLVAVVMGGKSAKARDAHMAELIAKYLPKASRSKGWDADLVADVKSAPAVAAGEAPVAVASAPAEPRVLVGANHPRPRARPDVAPVEVAEAEVLDPATVPLPVAAPVVAQAAPLPAPAPEVVASLTPLPPSQPQIMSASAMALPKPATALAATDAKRVKIMALPVEPIAVAPGTPDAVAALPSSAAEAFADVGTIDAESSDALSAIIEARIAETAFEPATPEPVETAAAAPAPRPAASPSSVPREAYSGWLIQVGAVESEAAATALLDKAKAKAGGVLAGTEPVTEVFEKNNQTFVRARFAGFDSQKAAKDACAALKKNAMACYALRL